MPLTFLFGRFPGRVVCLLAVLVVTACGDDDPFADMPDEAWAAEEVRELDFKSPVVVTRMTADEYNAEQASSLSDATIADLHATYGRLGFFPPEADLRTLLAGAGVSAGSGAYEADTKTIVLIEDPDEQVAVHEFVHALQDQHFDLLAYRRRVTSDRVLARRAVIEGDAMLAQLRYVQEVERGGDLSTVDWPAVLQSQLSIDVDLMESSSVPLFFLGISTFTYSHGLEYSAKNLVDVSLEDGASPLPVPHDWSRQDSLFQDRAPDTTEQVLELRYGNDSSDDPIRLVGNDQIPPSLSDHLLVHSEDSLGRWYVYLLFYPLSVSEDVDASAVASAWDGDHVLFVTDESRGDTTVPVWTTTWDDDASAQAFLDAFAAVHGATDDGDEFPESATSRTGESLWLERRGVDVVVIVNAAEPDVRELANAAFEGDRS